MAETIDIKRIEESGADKEVLEVYKLLKRFKEDSDREWWKEFVFEKPWKAAWENELWSEEDQAAMKEKGQIPLTINDMFKGVQASSATVTASKPGVQILPVGSGDLYVAELLKRGIDYILEQSGGMNKLQRLVKFVKTGSAAFLDVSYDQSKGVWGKILIKVAQPIDVYWDKYSEEEDLSDSPLIKARLVSREYVKDNYPDLKEEDLMFTGGVQKDETPGKSSGLTGQDNYAAGEASKGDTGADEDEDSKKDIWEIEAWLIRKKKEFWLVAVNPQDQGLQKLGTFESKEDAEAAQAQVPPEMVTKVWDRMVEVRQQRIIVGKKLVEQTDNPHGIDADGDPVLPLIPLFHDETLRGFPVGPSFFALEVSKERNKRRMQAIYTVSKNLEAPIVTTDDYKWVSDPKHGDIMVVSKNNAVMPSRLLPGTTTAEIMQLQQVALDDVKNIYDAQDVMVGKLPASDASGRTILALQDMAGMMTKPFTAKLEDCIVRMAKVVLAIMLKKWPAEMWMRLIEPREMQTFVPDEIKAQAPEPNATPNPQAVENAWMQAIDTIANKGMSIIDLDVKVAAGSTMPTNRIAKRAEAVEMVKAGIYDVRAALEYVDDPKAEEVATRMDKQNEMMALQGMKK